MTPAPPAATAATGLAATALAPAPRAAAPLAGAPGAAGAPRAPGAVLAPASGGDPALAEAATRFESLILGEMLRAMRRATTGTGLARSEAERTFRDLQDRIWAEGLARVAPIGLVARLDAQGGAAAPAGAAARPVAAAVPAAPMARDAE